jgi:serine/threonine protein kinase
LFFEPDPALDSCNSASENGSLSCNRCGTPTYVSPEVLKNVPYDQRADMWSCGVILFVLLCGYPPFVDENQSELFRKIRMSEWNMNGEEWGSVSAEAKNLVRQLLVPNPAQRITPKEALQCEWLRGEGDPDPVPDSELTQSGEVFAVRKSKLKSAGGVFTGRAVRKSPQSSVEAKVKKDPSNPAATSKPQIRDLGPEHLRRFDI